MTSMLRSRDGKVLGLVLAVLVLVVGFCAFDAGEHENGHAALHLCLGMVLTSVTVTVVSRLPLTGLASIDGSTTLAAFAARVPAPPPRPALS